MPSGRDEVVKILTRLLRGGPLTTLPKRRGDLMLLLALAASQLNEHGSLGEADVNEILKNWLGAFCSPYVVDHVTIRRYLVDTRLLERNSEGSCYQVVDANVDQLIDRNARVIEPVRVLAEIEEQREQRKQRRQHG